MRRAQEIAKITDCWVNGDKLVPSARFPVWMPASENVIASVGDADASVIDKAINAAESALETWQWSDAKLRHDFLLDWAKQLKDHFTYLAELISLESGKVIREAKGELSHCISMLQWYAGESRRVQGEYIQTSTNQQNLVYKQAVGIVACITPWNFPAASVIVKVGAAIASGCTTLLKPSEETPLIALALAELASTAGLPKGVFNVITSSQPEIFAAALKDQRIRMLSFTGSTHVGKHLYQLCAKTVKRVALELGGNAPFIVFDDCDINLATDALINARFYNAGQICVGANRIYVQTSIYSEFCEALTEKVSALRVGNGLEDDIDIGPLINRKAVEHLQNLIADATDKGAKIRCGGGLANRQSLMFAPTVIAEMSDDMLACQQEIFGPVACLYRFNDEQEVLRRANATQAGLAAYVFTRHHPTLLRVSRQLDVGVVGANSTQLFADNLPFGGIKESGIGKEQGLHCLEEYLDSKCIALGVIE